MFTSSNWRIRKKQLAMHCRPGIVSHSCAEVPTSWKHCCAIFRWSRDPEACPSEACTTPLRMYSCDIIINGWVGLRIANLRRRGVEVADQLVGLIHCVTLEVVDDQVEPGLGQHVHQRRQHLHRLLAVREDHHVVAEEVRGLQVHAVVAEHLELGLRGLTVVQAEVVAGLEVDSEQRVGKGLQVHAKDLEGDVVVVELVVAHRDVHVHREVLPALQKHALVDVHRLLVVAAREVHRGEGELVGLLVAQRLVVRHQLGLVALPVRQVKEQAVAQQTLGPLYRGLLGLLVALLEEEAAS